MVNLELYDKVRAVPDEAKKPITGGRLNGKTDINPMWRIKALTEQFGPCGIGWRYVITDKRLEAGSSGEVSAFVDIDLYIKHEGQWSEPIPGTGGSMFVQKERSGLYTNDECFKMALTDAISVSCKALGFGADVYWDKDKTKYGRSPDTIGTEQRKTLGRIGKEKWGDNAAAMFTQITGYKSSAEVPVDKYDEVLSVIEGA